MCIKNSIDVVINNKTLGISKYGDIFGVIYITVNDIVFPELEWNDFPMNVMIQWLNELARYANNEESCIVLSFTDGPFDISLNRECEKSSRLRLVQRGRDTNIIHADSLVFDIVLLKKIFVSMAE